MPPTSAPSEDAEAAGDQHRAGDFVEGHQQGREIDLPIAIKDGQRLRQGRQEQLGQQARQGHDLPQDEEETQEHPADGGGSRPRHLCTSRRLANLLPDALAQLAELLGCHHFVAARPRQRNLM